MSGGPASVEDFVAFLRASGITEAQIPSLQRVAEQLLLVAGTQDLMAVAPDLANRWRDELRKRNPTEAQLALIARGISALQAFQRKRSNPVSLPPLAESPPAARVPPARSPTGSAYASVAAARPPPGLSGPKKALVVAGLALVLVGSVVYTVVASRKAVLENRADDKILTQRNAERKIGIFYPSYTFTRQPAVACQPAVLEQVNRAVDLGGTSERRRQALEMLQDALVKDPSCLPAARVLTILENQLAGVRGVETLKDLLLSPAEQNPADAAAQMKAAYYSRQMGDGEGYRKYLEAAQAINPDEPLLDNAWGSYWDLFAQPRDFEKELIAERREVEKTSDPGTVSNLAALYLKISDYDRAKEMCDRFAAAVPDDRDLGRLGTCLRVALATQDAAAEAKLAERYWKALPKVQAACGHADMAGYLLKYTCRHEDALKEANTAIEQRCAIPGAGQRRHALIALQRYGEAAEPPPDGQYWDGIWGEKDTEPVAYPDRDRRAQALAMLGHDDEALAILEPIAAKDWFAQIEIGMIQNGVLKQRVEAAGTCTVNLERSERVAGAASGYMRYKLLDDARKQLDQAFALNPKSPGAWANKVYMLSIDGKLNEAAQAGEEAIAMGVDDPTLAGNLGYVYQQLGQCDKAIPLFKRKLIGRPWTVPNYTNLAKCLETVGRDSEAASMWAYVQGGRPKVFWWMYALIVVAAVGLYLGGKLTLIKLMPDRFGHLKFP